MGFVGYLRIGLLALSGIAFLLAVQVGLRIRFRPLPEPSDDRPERLSRTGLFGFVMLIFSDVVALLTSDPYEASVDHILGWASVGACLISIVMTAVSTARKPAWQFATAGVVFVLTALWVYYL